MPELQGQSSTFEKNSPQRRAVAKQLRAIRRVERAEQYIKNRSAQDYQDVLNGLQYYFDYVRKLGISDVVLDVGSGTTRGIWGLSQSELGKNLKFMATGLDRDPAVGHYIGNENFKITSGEVLRGIPDSSVAAILALYSVAYSASPEMVVTRFDQVLVPGGVIKGAFRSHNLTVAADFYEKTQFKTPDPFIEALEQLGYDIAVFDNDIGSNMVAIKPGGVPGVTAKNLLDSDRITHEQQKAADIKALLRKTTTQVPSEILQQPVNQIPSLALSSDIRNDLPIQHPALTINSLIMINNPEESSKQNYPSEKYNHSFLNNLPQEISYIRKNLREQNSLKSERLSIASLAKEYDETIPSFSTRHTETNEQYPDVGTLEVLAQLAVGSKSVRSRLLTNL